METSLSTLSTMASALGAEASLVRRIPSAKPHRSSVLIKVRRKGASRVPSVDLRIAISGSLDSGKSTLTAVLTHGRDGRALLDNGRGTARMSVLRHKHELESGRTSSLSQQGGAGLFRYLHRRYLSLFMHPCIRLACQLC